MPVEIQLHHLFSDAVQSFAQSVQHDDLDDLEGNQKRKMDFNFDFSAGAARNFGLLCDGNFCPSVRVDLIRCQNRLR